MGSTVDMLRSIRARHEGGEAAWRALETLAGEMDAAGRARDDPIREVFALLGDRWTMLILLSLGAGRWRQATLKRIIGALAIEGAISQRMLTLKLRALERDGFVIRSVTGDVPPHVDYRLSDQGVALLAEAERLLDWIKARRTAIEAARASFDARTEP
jgi:DNA-binding HxlR family transcriptional regulator